ncbi:MAG: MFS transporter [Dermatophilaceae bacterium]
MSSNESGSPGGRPVADRPRLVDFWAQLPRDGRFLISSVAIESLGRGLILPFGVVYLHEVRKFPLELTGTLLGVPALVALFVVWPGGALIDRLGPRVVIILAALAQIMGNVVLAVATSPLVAAFGLGLTGAAFAVVWPAVNAMIAALVPSGIRQRYYGINFSLMNLGIGLGGATSGLVVDVASPSSFTTIYLLAACGFLAPLTIMLGPLRHVSGRAGPPPAQEQAKRVSYWLVVRSTAMPSLLVTFFLVTFIGYGQIQAGLTAYARLEADVSTRVIGLAFAANTAAIVLLQLFVLQRIEGRRRTRVLLVMCAVWALAWSVIGLAGLPGLSAPLLASLLIVAGAAIFGLGETLMQPTLPAITNDLAPAHLRGRYNAVTSAAFQLGAVTAPVVAGLLFDHQRGGVFIGMLVGGCGALALFVWRVLEPGLPGSANGRQ